MNMSCNLMSNYHDLSGQGKGRTYVINEMPRLLKVITLTLNTQHKNAGLSYQISVSTLTLCIKVVSSTLRFFR